MEAKDTSTPQHFVSPCQNCCLLKAEAEQDLTEQNKIQPDPIMGNAQYILYERFLDKTVTTIFFPMKVLLLAKKL